MKIYIGSDHGGFQLKEYAKTVLTEIGLAFEDVGTHSAERADYPQFGKAVAENVVNNPGAFGIVICGTGIGISIAANKVKGARAALCFTTTHARLAREHNDANILALGERTTGKAIAKDIINTFFRSTFEGGRHESRIKQITEIEA